jgi:hypothetical protein
VTFTDTARSIPDRVEQVTAVTDATGRYGARVPQGTWDVVVQLPAQKPAPFPPVHLDPLVTSSPVMDFLLPEAAQFPSFDGGLITDGGTPVAGATVTAVDSLGTAISSPSVSDGDGGYTVVLPPATSTSQALLQIGPPSTLDGGVAAFALDPFPTYPSVLYTSLIDLPLPAIASLTGKVIDPGGNPVPSARVYVRSAGMQWTLARSVAVDSNGVYSFTLRAGNYQIQAAPSPDANTPALSPPQTLLLPQVSTFDITCPVKVRRHGDLHGPDGRLVGANFQIIATRLNDGLITGRTASTVPTDANGVYRVIADGGRWRLEVVPPVDSPLPRKIFQVELDGTDPAESELPAVQISRPLEVVGTVRGSPAGAPAVLVADALLNFFSLDSSGTSVFLASARTDAQGRYKAVLPDVAQPGIGP